MTQLQPYRPAGSVFLFPQTKKRSPTIAISVVVIMLVWFGGFALFTTSSNGFSVFVMFILLAFLSVGILFGVSVGMRALTKMRLGEPQLTVSLPSIYRGAEISCEFVQPVKSQVKIQGAKIQLVYLEWVKWQQGTDTRTETHTEIIGEITFDADQKQSGDQIWLQARFQIPQDAMHNLSREHNRLQWVVVVSVEIPMWPDYYEEYALDFRG